MTAVRHLVTLLVVLSLGASSLWAGYEAGVAAFKKKKYKEAISEFESELKGRPNWYFPHYMMGLSHIQLRGGSGTAWCRAGCAGGGAAADTACAPIR